MCRLSLVAGSRGYSLVVVRRLLTGVTFLVAEHELQSLIHLFTELLLGTRKDHSKPFMMLTFYIHEIYI